MRIRLALLLVLMLAALAYWAGLDGPLVFDDRFNLSPIEDWLNGRQSWLSTVFGNTSGLFGRPVAMASFVLNAAVSGPAVWGFKVVNLAIHLCNGVLVYWLFKGLVSKGGLTRDPPAAGPWIAVLGASLWLLHPLLVSTVLYVVQRMAMLSATFTLVALLSYLHARIALSRGEKKRGIVLLIAAASATALATLSKENGILAPAMCAIVELFVFAPAAGKTRPTLSRAFIATALLLPAFVAVVLVAVQSDLILADYANRPFTLLERVLTQGRALWDYIGSLLLPYGPKLGLYHDDYRVSHGLTDPLSTSMAIIGWLATATLAWRMRVRVPGFALGLGIFLVGHALESTVFPLLMYFEHRNYLPAVGAIWALISLACAGGQRLDTRMDNGPQVFAGASIALVLTFAFATAARAGIWSSERTLLMQGLSYHPDSRWLRMDLAGWALRQEPPREDLARQQFSHMLSSENPDTRRMGAVAELIVDCSVGRPAPDNSVQGAFEGAPRTMEADLLLAYEGLADIVMTRKCPGLNTSQLADRLVSMLDRSSLPPREFNIRRLRYKAARLYVSANRPYDALEQANLAHDPNDVDPAIAAFIAELEISKGDLASASKFIEVAAEHVSPGNRNGNALISNLRAQVRSASARNQQQ